MRKLRISHIPVRLSLIIIVLFGLIPAMGFSVYHYRRVIENLQEGKNAHLNMIKEELRQGTESTIKAIDLHMAIEKKRLKRSVKSATENIYSLVEKTYARYSPAMPDPELQEMIRERLSEIRLFDGRGYVFAYSLDGQLQVYPPDPSMEGSAWLELTDSIGLKIIQEIIRTARSEGEGFLEYTWPLPSNKDIKREKISYIRLFAPLGWVIGTGDYCWYMGREIQEDVIAIESQRNTDYQGLNFVLDPEMNLLTGDPATPSEIPEDKTLRFIVTGMDRNILETSGEYFSFMHPSGSTRGSGPPVAMLGFARYYAPWGWTIGKAVNLETFQDRDIFLQQKLMKEVYGDLALTLIVLGLAVIFVFMIGKVYARFLEKNLAEFESFFKKAGREKSEISLDQVKFEELKTLGEMANLMVAKRVNAQETLQKVNLKLRDASRRLKDMANIDGLTRIANRRVFDRTLAKEWARATRDQSPLTLGMLDIDYFKLYNDTYGHQKGDECLIRVAAVLEESARRPADLAARYGGEEFVILLPQTDLSGGKERANRIRRQVAELAIVHESCPLGRVSFSMGLATTVPGPDSSHETLVEKADQALYRAKEKNRDRIECDPES